MIYSKFKNLILEGCTLINSIRNHGFSKGSTWLKCSHWPKGYSFWLKAWGMKTHGSFGSFFYWNDYFDQMLNRTFNQEKQIFKWSIQMPMA